MTLLQFLAALAALVLALWLIQTHAPTSPPVRQIALTVVVVLACAWLLAVAGILPLANPRLR